MSFRKIALWTMGMLLTSTAWAQFYTGGEDPASVRWSTFRTDHYKLIYPTGMDSLARAYARSLETFRPQVGRSIGYLPGGMYRKPMPVILHAHGGQANGSVTWAPRRMDLYTLPEAYEPEPMPWLTSLAVHENRHVAQLQFGADGLFRPFKWLVGDLFAGALSGVYPSTWFLEGDAVVAETALTPFGRGRRGDFLAYYRAAFDAGDWRNWYRWRYGSYRYAAPNHYALGYLTLAGIRTQYDAPLFEADYLHGVTRRPWRLFNIQRAVRKTSGRSFKGAFQDIMQSFQAQWAAEDRGPWTAAEPFSPVPSWYTVQGAPVAYDGGWLVKENSKVRATRLVLYKDGQAKTLRPFAAATGDLRPAGGRIYWSETVPDLRWGLRATSRIRYMEDGKVRNLTRTGRLYNPAPSPDGERIAVTEYPVPGGSKVRILDLSGHTLQTLTAPDGVQYIETAWVGKELYISYIDDQGTGIARWALTGQPETVLAPQPVSIAHLQGGPDGVLLSMDATGLNEVYRLTPQGTLIQLTATPYGAGAFTMASDTLYYAAQTHEGELLQKAPASGLAYRRAGETASHPTADRLAAQEQALSREPAALKDRSRGIGGTETTPKRYSKLLGIPYIHSWAPVYFDYDRIEEMSGDVTWREGGLGATALFQNLLGTASGSLGYSYHKDEYTGQWRHSGHFQMTYTGLFPVFEVNMDFNDRDLIQYSRVKQEAGMLSFTSTGGRLVDSPSFQGALKLYVPLNFSSGGWNRGFVPQLQYTFSNDRFNKTLPVRTAPDVLGETVVPASLSRLEPGDNVLMQSLTVSARGYIIRPTASALDYPRWGFGAEGGYRARLGLSDLFSPALYGYVYGYLPGLMANQGLRLSAMWQHQTGSGTGENVVTTRPRGFQDTQVSSFLASYAPEQLRLSADYSIPVWVGDISWFSPLFYVTHFVVKPHVDYTLLKYGRGLSGGGSLVSAGAEVTARLAHFLWLPFPTSAGIVFDWNGGSEYDPIEKQGIALTRTYVGGVFSIDF